MYFVHLPDVILSELFCLWFGLQNVVTLDTSFTNHRNRKLLVHVLSSGLVFESEHIKLNDQNSVEYIIKHQIKLKFMHVSPALLDSSFILNSSNKLDCSEVMTLQFSFLMDKLKCLALINQCHKLTKIDGLINSNCLDCFFQIDPNILIKITDLGRLLPNCLKRLNSYKFSLKRVFVMGTIKDNCIEFFKFLENNPNIEGISILGDVIPKKNLLFLSENAHYFQNVQHFNYDFDVDAKTAKHMFKLFPEF
jgi:hypothetical protein